MCYSLPVFSPRLQVGQGKTEAGVPRSAAPNPGGWATPLTFFFFPLLLFLNTTTNKELFMGTAPWGGGGGGTPGPAPPPRAPRGSACVRRRVASALAGGEGAPGEGRGGGWGRELHQEAMAAPPWHHPAAYIVGEGSGSPRLGGSERAEGGAGVSVSVCLSVSPSLPRIYGLYFLESGEARMRVQLVCVVLLALASCSLCSGKSRPPPRAGWALAARRPSPPDARICGREVKSFRATAAVRLRARRGAGPGERGFVGVP